MRPLMLTALLLVPAVASADAVGPEDTTVVCPRGSQRVTHHCGTVCQPLPCESDTDCRDGLRCVVDARLCINTEPYCGRGGADYDRVYGECGRPCSAGSCRSIRACGMELPMEDSGPPADGGVSVVTYGCGCRVDGEGGGEAWLLGLAVLGVAAIRKRRASRRR